VNYTILTCEQRTPDWYEARRGRLTASVAGEMLATVQKGEAASRRNLRLRLVLERLTGKVLESNYVSKAMQQGIDREAEARLAYEAVTGELVQNTGFVSHNTLMAGASLDGCVFGPDGRIVKLLELKSPEPAAHLSYLRTGRIGAGYEAQVLHSLWLTGAVSCDWMSYQPDFPEGKQTKLVTIQRDDAVIADYDAKVRTFLAEVDAEVVEVERLEVA
jgi:hypothetical protein